MAMANVLWTQKETRHVYVMLAKMNAGTKEFVIMKEIVCAKMEVLIQIATRSVPKIVENIHIVQKTLKKRERKIAFAFMEEYIQSAISAPKYVQLVKYVLLMNMEQKNVFVRGQDMNNAH